MRPTLLLSLSCLTSLVALDGEMGQLFAPVLMPWTGKSSHSAWSIGSQDEDLDLDYYQATLTGRSSFGSKDEGYLGLRYANLDLDSPLLVAGSPLPSHLEDLALNMTWRHITTSRNIYGIRLESGSASDDPFGSSHSVYHRVLLFSRIGTTGKDAWLLGANWDSNRFIWNGIPLPFAAYNWNREDYRLLLGLPFSFLSWDMDEKWQLSAMAGVGVAGGISYAISDSTRIGLRYRWDGQSYFRSKRQDKDDQLSIRSQLITLGVESKLPYGMRLNGFAGYAFERKIGEGSDEDEIDRTGVRVDPGWIIGMQFSFGIGRPPKKPSKRP